MTGEAVIRTVLFKPINTVIGVLSELFYLIGVQLAGSDW